MSVEFNDDTTHVVIRYKDGHARLLTWEQYENTDLGDQWSWDIEEMLLPEQALVWVDSMEAERAV